MFLKFVIFFLSLSIAESGKANLDYIYQEGLNYDYQYQADYQSDYSNDSQQYPDYVDNSHENQSESIEVPEKINRRIPKILSNPKEILVNEGATIKLPCEVDTLDNLLLIWSHGERMLSMGDKSFGDSRISLEANGTSLVISLAVPSDSGKYRCKVSTQGNVEIEHNVKIRVAPLVKAVKTVPVMAGDDAVLKCGAEQGFPQPDLYWTRENHKFRDGSPKLVGSEIWLYKVTRKDNGRYTCHGDNKWTYIANDTIELKVLYAPEIEQLETFIHTKEGDEVEVTCLVHANPPAEVEWYFNGQLLERDDNVIYERKNRHNIIISKLGKHYYGKYMCRAINKYGEQSKTTEVSGSGDVETCPM